MTDELIIQGKRLVRCNSLSSSVTVPEGVAVIGKYAFACNNAVEKVVLPSTIKVIEKAAFFECEKLTSVDAKNVQNIGESAFENCNVLNVIKLGMNLKKVEPNAFNKCYNIMFDAPQGGYADKYAQNNDIYCTSFSQENEKISVKTVLNAAKAAKKIKPMLNLNMVVLGGSGTGKSRFIVKPNLMQCNTFIKQ